MIPSHLPSRFIDLILNFIKKSFVSTPFPMFCHILYILYTFLCLTLIDPQNKITHYGFWIPYDELHFVCIVQIPKKTWPSLHFFRLVEISNSSPPIKGLGWKTFSPTLLEGTHFEESLELEDDKRPRIPTEINHCYCCSKDLTVISHSGEPCVGLGGKCFRMISSKKSYEIHQQVKWVKRLTSMGICRSHYLDKKCWSIFFSSLGQRVNI